MGFEDPRRVLARHGLRPDRRFSQNFLTAPHVVRAAVDALAPRSTDAVVELGPGLGTLTSALLDRAARVIAVERDRRMLAVLAEELGGRPGFSPVRGDATTLDLPSLVPAEHLPALVAGNLPYAVTGAIFRRLVEQAPLVRRAVVMVQREVQERLVAPPGTAAYGPLTVFVSNLFEVTTILRVPATCFHPAPKVESALVALSPRAKPRAALSAAFEAVVRAAFGQRRKMLRRALRALAPDAAREASLVDRALARAALDGMRRGETLTVEELGAIADAWARETGPR